MCPVTQFAWNSRVLLSSPLPRPSYCGDVWSEPRTQKLRADRCLDVPRKDSCSQSAYLMYMHNFAVTYTHVHLLWWHFAQIQIGKMISLAYRCQVVTGKDRLPGGTARDLFPAKFPFLRLCWALLLHIKTVIITPGNMWMPVWLYQCQDHSDDIRGGWNADCNPSWPWQSDLGFPQPL